MSKKVCIVGGGFGGLTAAALLQHSGMEVTLLEKNESVGGRGRAWRQDGFLFDMGPSWYLMPEVFERFFRILDRQRSDYYELQELDPYYRVFFSADQSVDITGDRDETRRLFDSLEPDGGARLERYLSEAKYKYDVAMSEFLYRDYKHVSDFFNRRLIAEGLRLGVLRSLDSFVSGYFTDRRAKQILEYAMVFLGTSPDRAPALYSIMSHVDMSLGVWFPVGGMVQLVEGVRRLAEELGVTVQTGEAVRAIEIEKRKAVAVRTERREIAADVVLSNADYAFTELKLLPPEARSYRERYWKRRVLAPTMFIIYLGLSKKLGSVVHHNLYFSDPWESHFDAIFDKPRWPERPSYYVSCASFDDPAVAPAGRENIFFLVPVAPGLDDSDENRERFAEQILDHFEELTGESVRDAILIKRIYSHRDFSSDYNAYEGTALGLAHTLFQTAVFRPAHRSKKVKNLYYSGQYTHPGVGVPMTFISSEIVSNQIVSAYG